MVPDKTPAISENRTSFVINARIIAIIGGRIDNHPTYTASIIKISISVCFFVIKIKYVYVLDEWIIPRTGIVCNKNKKNMIRLCKITKNLTFINYRYFFIR